MIEQHNFDYRDYKLQEDFVKRHLPFLNALKDIKSACDIAIFKTPTETLESRLMLYLARMVFDDDFGSILTLCANGLSTGAMQILRGMFERTVTLCYLKKHMDQTHLFLNYYWVDSRKHVEAVEKEFPGKMRKEDLEEIRAQYDKVKKDYEITDCEKCGTKRVNISWSKINLVEMAREVDFDYSLIHAGYYRPMEETHPKVGAVLRRLQSKGDEGVTYKGGPKPEEDKDTLLMAHWLVLKALGVLRDTSNIEALKEPLEKSENDFAIAWNLNDLRSK